MHIVNIRKVPSKFRNSLGAIKFWTRSVALKFKNSWKKTREQYSKIIPFKNSRRFYDQSFANLAKDRKWKFNSSLILLIKMDDLFYMPINPISSNILKNFNTIFQPHRYTHPAHHHLTANESQGEKNSYHPTTSDERASHNSLI